MALVTLQLPYSIGSLHLQRCSSAGSLSLEGGPVVFSLMLIQRCGVTSFCKTGRPVRDVL